VLVLCGVGVNHGVGVQVAGRRTVVGVGVGISMVGTSVAGGKGFNDEVGSLNIETTTMITMTAPIKTSMERTSQILIFNFISALLQPRDKHKIYFFCEYIRV
jgi:hypothetical protein